MDFLEGFHGIRYYPIDRDDWRANYNNAQGYRVTGSSEAGYSMEGPGGDLVMWSSDDRQAYRVIQPDRQGR